MTQPFEPSFRLISFRIDSMLKIDKSRLGSMFLRGEVIGGKRKRAHTDRLGDCKKSVHTFCPTRRRINMIRI